MSEPPGSTPESGEEPVPDAPGQQSPALSGDAWRRLLRELGPPRTARTAEQDRRLHELLGQSDFQGPAYDVVMSNLVDGARRIVLAGITSGSIFAACAKIGRPITDAKMIELLQRDAGERDEVVAELLAVGATRFRDDALIGGRWKPLGGSSLQTFFVGALVRELPNVFRKWSKDHQRFKPGLTDPSQLPSHGQPPAPDPVRHAVTADQIEQALAGADPGIRIMAEMIKLRYPWAEMAEVLGISEKAAQQRWTRFVRRIGNDESDEGGQR
ncbi:hypothetical protein [Streptomyces plumbiresistens]